MVKMSKCSWLSISALFGVTFLCCKHNYSFALLYFFRGRMTTVSLYIIDGVHMGFTIQVATDGCRDCNRGKQEECHVIYVSGHSATMI